MPPKIKTRETVKDIKTIDKPALLSRQMKKALIRTRNTTVRAAESEQPSEESRPEETAQQTVENTATETVRVAVSGGKNAVRQGKRIIQKQKDRSTAYEATPLEKDAPLHTPTEQRITEQGRQLARKQAETRNVINRRIQEKPDNSPHSPPIKTDSCVIRTKRVETSVKHSGRSIKNTRTPVSVSEKVPTEQMRRSAKAAQMRYTRRKEVKRVAGTSNRIVKSVVRRIVDATRALTGSITTGMAVASVSVVIVCLVGLMVASPLGIFFSHEDSGTGYTMPDAVTILNREFTQAIEQIKENVTHDSVEMDNAGSAEMISNWDDVLAIYAVRTTTKDDAVEVATVTEEKLNILREIFWDMNRISYYTETVGNDEDGYSTVLHISVQTISCWDMVRNYHFDRKQQTMLEELMRPEYAELFQTLTGSYRDIVLSPVEIQDILEQLPEDLSEERRQVILTAYQLLGKVDYFWGGKSYVMGWDSRWGTPMRVTSPGSSTTGTIRPFGLDCSGYVDWVFYNATNGTYTPSGGNGGTTAQKNNCAAITWADALPGDLVFYPRDTHVGIICGYDEYGNPLIIHCASGWDTIVVTGKGTFTSVVRPEYYN